MAETIFCYLVIHRQKNFKVIEVLSLPLGLSENGSLIDLIRDLHKMRIGYLYDLQVYPPKGGNHVHALELTQAFLMLGHSVCVVDDSTMPGVANFSSDDAALEQFINNIDVLYVRIDARFTRSWKVLTRCMEIKGDRPVVWEINSPANEALAYSWLGGRSMGTGCEHESVVKWMKRFLHATRKLPGIYFEEKHRRRLATDVIAAVCVSTSLSSYAKEGLGIHDVVVLPNGGSLISQQEIRDRAQRREGNKFTVLYSGSAIYPWQGLNYLADAIVLAKREAPDVLFVLAVNQRVAGLPEGDNVLIRERLNREEILDEICAADVCVALHPEYPWSKYRFHNSPMKLFEYMACMRPVVTSNLGQMREIIRDGHDGLLCRNEPRAILDKVIFLRDNPELATAIGRRGWERIQTDFNWLNNARETLSLFDRALGKSHNLRNGQVTGESVSRTVKL